MKLFTIIYSFNDCNNRFNTAHSVKADTEEEAKKSLELLYGDRFTKITIDEITFQNVRIGVL